MEIKNTVQELSMKLYFKVKAFTQDKEAATAIEYAVIAGLISIAVLTAATPIGARIGVLMNTIKTAIGAT